MFRNNFEVITCVKKAIGLIKKSSQCRITYCCYTYQILELFRYHILRTDNLRSAKASSAPPRRKSCVRACMVLSLHIPHTSEQPLYNPCIKCTMLFVQNTTATCIKMGVNSPEGGILNTRAHTEIDNLSTCEHKTQTQAQAMGSTCTCDN